jgi:hypothetical protein
VDCRSNSGGHQLVARPMRQLMHQAQGPRSVRKLLLTRSLPSCFATREARTVTDMHWPSR